MDPIDWAPYAHYGDDYKVMAPKGLLLSLATEDIEGAQYAPTIRKYLHPPEGNKMCPNTWLPQEGSYAKKRPSRRLITERIVNPLDPEYKIPQGVCLLPAGEKIFSKRVSDNIDVSDIHGTRAESLYKGPVRVRAEDHVFDNRCHPAKRTRERYRINVGQGLELWDINIGKKQFGFDRHPRSNPLEPLYPTEVEETAEKKFMRLKKKVIPPRRRFWISGEPAIDKLMAKLYWKPLQLSEACKRYDFSNSERVTYGDLRRALEEFDVRYTDEEFARLIPFADQEQEGNIAYFRLAKAIRWPMGLEKLSARRLGQDEWEGIHCTLGQSVQVLVDSPRGKGKKQMREQEEAYEMLDVITGMPLQRNGVVAVPPRELLALSYGEQLATEADRKKALQFTSFMPEPNRPSKRLIPPLLLKQPAQAEQPQAVLVPVSDPTPPEVPVPVPVPALAPAQPPLKQKSVNLGASRKSVAIPELPEPVIQEMSQAPAAEGSMVPLQKPPTDQINLKLPVLARKSVAQTKDGMGNFSNFYEQARSKKISPPNFKRRILREQRSADVESVLYLG